MQVTQLPLQMDSLYPACWRVLRRNPGKRLGMKDLAEAIKADGGMGAQCRLPHDGNFSVAVFLGYVFHVKMN